MIKQSVCIPMIKPPEIETELFFKGVHEIGFNAVEYWTCPENIEEISELAQKHSLAISCISGHGDIAHGMNDEKEHLRILKELEVSISIAKKYNITGLICFSGETIPGQSSETSIKNCIKCFREIAPMAEENNVLLNMELLNTIVDHPGYECNHTSWGVQVVEQVGSPNVKLLFDIYHMQIMDGNLISSIESNLDHIGHFHTAGVPGRFDLDAEQEINYVAICKMLSANQYQYFLGHEFHPKKSPLESLQDAYLICNQ